MFLIISIAIMSAVALAVTYFTSMKYRQEDKLRMYDPQFKIYSPNVISAWGAWIIVALISIVEIFISSLLLLSILTITGSAMAASCLFPAVFNRKSYYTADQDRISYIDNGNIGWSHKWTDIASVHAHGIRYKKVTIIYYDIMLNDGRIIRDLPELLQEPLNEHFDIGEPEIKAGLLTL